MDPKNKKILYAAGAAIGVFLLYRALRNEGGIFPGGGYAPDPTGNGGIDNPGGAQIVFNARVVAEALYDAMRETGTDEEAIISILRNVNQSQFGQVVQAFGKRSYNDVFGNQINYNPLFGDLPLVNLPGWLRSELSTKEYNILRMKYPNYL